MKYISTNNKAKPVIFSDAVINGLAEDGGLYMPEYVPVLPSDFWDNLSRYSFHEIAQILLYPYTSETWDKDTLHAIIKKAFNFDVPLEKVNARTFVTELFHGPTLAFKDFGARFLAQTFEHLAGGRKITILVATSGDTGSAVAQGFKNTENVSVLLLYPKGKVSELQEQQLTTVGGNVTALEITGSFDDCQRLVKQAFSDTDLRKKIHLSSANSINIARLLPQSIYYAYALAQYQKSESEPPVFVVPSGNMGNVTAGLLAMKMGMPVDQFVIATNINDVVPEYLEKGIFKARKSHNTISNAMDVGDPSNLARIQYLFNYSIDEMRSTLKGYSFTDNQTRKTIKKVFDETGYLLDPHTAIGYQAAVKFRQKINQPEKPVIIMATAHPAKFKNIVEPIIKKEIDLPQTLKDCMIREKHSILMEPSYNKFKRFLLEQSENSAVTNI